MGWPRLFFVLTLFQTAPYFNALNLMKKNSQLNVWELKKLSFGSRFSALRSRHVLGNHFWFGQNKFILSKLFVLTLYSFENEVSHDWDTFIYNSQLIPLISHFMVGSKPPTMSESTLDLSCLRVINHSWRLWVIQKVTGRVGEEGSMFIQKLSSKTVYLLVTDS